MPNQAYSRIDVIYALFPQLTEVKTAQTQKLIEWHNQITTETVDSP